ncbi:MAG: ATP synthase F1 subunit gamma [Thermotogae bacterium]|nr:ATP synthase F1 subunit gamma [Thermotogota bacterium]
MSRGKLRALKRRINSTISTMHITKAMEMVARAKVQRAERIWARYRNFLKDYRETFKKLIQSYDFDEIENIFIESPERKVSKTAILVVSSDMGLCGAYNSELLKLAEREAENLGGRFAGYLALGVKANSYFRYRKIKIIKGWEKLYDMPRYDNAEYIFDEIRDLIDNGKIDSLKVAYVVKTSTLVQLPRIIDLIPLKVDERIRKEEYEYEPKLEELLNSFIPRLIIVELLNLMMEAKVSEFYSRQNAMRNATENASNLIDRFRLEFNKLRQASITQEIIEVMNGAEALKEV